MMGRECNRDDLEGLAIGKLAPMIAGEVEAHAAGCASCKRELDWLRAERDLLAGRALRAPAVPEKMWLQIATQLPQAVTLSDAPTRWVRWVGVVAAVACVVLVIGAVRRFGRSVKVNRKPLVSAPKVAQPSSDEDVLVAAIDVPGPVRFSVDGDSADVTVRAGAEKRVRIEVVDGSARSVELVLGSDGVEARFDGGRTLGSGTVRVEVPAGSPVVVSTRSGDVTVLDVRGDAAVHTVSGDVDLSRPLAVDVQTVSGDVKAREVAGVVRMKTVSGDGEIASVVGPSPRLTWNSTSGDVVWSGACAAGCSFEAHSTSGDVRLGISGEPSFEAELTSRSGELRGNLGERMVAASASRGSSRVRAGKGEGRIACVTVSGDLVLDRR